MSRIESGFSERVGARISPELKNYLRVLVDSGEYDNEADAVREALWHYIEQREIVSQSAPTPEPTDMSHNDLERIEWLLNAVFIMLAIVGSRLLNALTNNKMAPAALADEAIQETIYNQSILRARLDKARHIAHQSSADDKG